MSCDESHDLWKYINSSHFMMAVDDNGYFGKSLKFDITIKLLCSHSTADEVVNVYSARPCRLVPSVELNMLEISQPLLHTGGYLPPFPRQS